MAHSLDVLLDVLRRDIERVGVRVPAPASEGVLDHLQSRCIAELGTAVPEEYLDLLRRMNGFVRSSITFSGAGWQPLRHTDGSRYGDLYIPDLVTNATEVIGNYEPHFDGLLILSDSSPLYGWSPSESRWVQGFYDGGVSGYYDSFTELLEDALSTISVYPVDI